MNSKAMRILAEVYEGCCGVYGSLLCDAYLYGSYARGDYDNESDVDILATADLDEPEHGEYFDKIAILSSHLSLKHNVTVSVSVKPKSQFLKYAEILPFYINVLKEDIKYAV